MAAKTELIIPEEFTRYESTSIRKMISPDYLQKVQKSIQAKWPMVQRMKEPITGEQWISACTKYSLRELTVVMDSMEREVHKYGYTFAFRVLLKWCYNNRLDMTTEDKEKYTQELIDRYPSLRLKLLRHPNPNRYKTPQDEQELFEQQ